MVLSLSDAPAVVESAISGICYRSILVTLVADHTPQTEVSAAALRANRLITVGLPRREAIPHEMLSPAGLIMFALTVVFGVLSISYNRMNWPEVRLFRPHCDPVHTPVAVRNRIVASRGYFSPT